jgi:hypothetical protein
MTFRNITPPFQMDVEEAAQDVTMTTVSVEQRYLTTLRLLVELIIATGDLPDHVLPDNMKGKRVHPDDVLLGITGNEFAGLYDRNEVQDRALAWVGIGARHDLKSALRCDDGDDCRCWEVMYALLDLPAIDRSLADHGANLPLPRAALGPLGSSVQGRVREFVRQAFGTPPVAERVAERMAERRATAFASALDQDDIAAILVSRRKAARA